LLLQTDTTGCFELSITEIMIHKFHIATEKDYLDITFRDGRREIVPGPARVRQSWRKHLSITKHLLKRHVATEMEYLVITFRDGRVELLNGPAECVYDDRVHKTVELKQIQRKVASQDEQVLIQYRDGRVEHLYGPHEMNLDPLVHQSITVAPIQRFIADQHQYLVISFKDGQKTHMRGPVVVMKEPFLHEKITVNPAIKLAANEAVVVYKRLDPTTRPSTEAVEKVTHKKNGGDHEGKPLNGMVDKSIVQHGGPVTGVDRRVVKGPAVFMPEANEWVHTFSWHGSLTKDGKGSKTGHPGDEKVPHALSFQVLRCMPDQMYYSVRDVRTSDDAHLTVHLMLFYELHSIEAMLDSTNDMIGDFINAASADVMTFAASTTYEQFLQRTGDLSDLATFPILRSRMNQTGTSLLKVVYRGYSTSKALQAMMDQAIAQRTKLRLESDAAAEEQTVMRMQLQARQERSQQERALEEAGARHQCDIDAMKSEQARHEADMLHKQQLRHMQEEAEAELRRVKLFNDEDIRLRREHQTVETEKLSSQHGMGVDLTKVLCALSTIRPDSHLKIETTPGTGQPALHLQIPERK